MSIPFSRAPHIEGAAVPPRSSSAPNAALLVDFDNVTMGMRSDLSKELKTLLSSDVIKGKVTVQRAYADWRRYPQYIVPLSEASIDLIFAPAYGSNKKNATDIRMAIDGIELVFTRPEIGTYILLTGDSDFSSLVLKLKEYGKYVIGVGMQESSSDILVQNCDEYYSYTSLSGLRKAEEGSAGPTDPWSLVSQAAQQMGRRGDVMRSDRLKQVMLDIDPSFDEKSFGFSKFSRFVAEASKKGLIEIRRMENGQYEILASAGAKKPDESKDSGRPSERSTERRRSSSGSGRGRGGRAGSDDGTSETTKSKGPKTLEPAYALLRKAVSDLLEETSDGAVRDSDVKRRMLALQHGFDEGELGFPKFSRFLHKADEDGIVGLEKTERGNYQVLLPADAVLGAPEPPFDRKSGASPLAETGETGMIDLERLRLPTGRDSVVKYLSNSYGGVGKRTAETLVDSLGERLFHVLQAEPSKVAEILPPARAERVLSGWRADFQRRSERHAREQAETTPGSTASGTAIAPESRAGHAGSGEDVPGAVETGNGDGAEQPRVGRSPRRGRRTRGGAGSAA